MNSEPESPVKKVYAALSRCRELLANNAGWAALKIAERQLEMLHGHLSGEPLEKEVLLQIDFGLLAAREFDDHENAFAKQLYEVQDIVCRLSEDVRGNET